MTRLFVFILLTMLTSPAFAQEASSAPPKLDAEICKFMIAHQPAAGVNYTPGVDVQGKPVVEADVDADGSFFVQPDEISFPLTVDLAKYAGLSVPQGTETKVDLGIVAIDGNGIVTLDGKPMQGESEAALRGLCIVPPEPVKTQEKPDKQ